MMESHFLHLVTTPAVAAAQTRYYGGLQTGGESAPDLLGPAEREFVAARDSFYLSTVTENGWPYVQHRGGPVGFLRVLNPGEIAFADVRGNRQLLTTGNVAANDRVALFLMDYPQRSRLKILGHGRIIPATEDPQLAKELTRFGASAPERIMRIAVVAFEWNCPKYITPRYTKAEIETLIRPLHSRIAELEADLARSTESRSSAT
jgi:uncharacterized protein